MTREEYLVRLLDEIVSYADSVAARKIEPVDGCWGLLELLGALSSADALPKDFSSDLEKLSAPFAAAATETDHFPRGEGWRLASTEFKGRVSAEKSTWAKSHGDEIRRAVLDAARVLRDLRDRVQDDDRSEDA